MKIALIVFQVCISSLGFAEVVSVNYHVENDRGIPIRDAEVMTTTQKDYLVLPCIGSTKHKKYIKNTDRQGNVRCSFRCHHGDFNVYVEADGHYPFRMLYQRFRTDYDFATKSVKFFEKEKRMNVTLFRKVKPIPMRSYIGDVSWQAFGTNVWNKCGYDLELHDWLPPQGRGKVADFYIDHAARIDGETLDSVGHMTFDKYCGAYIVYSKLDDKRLLVYSADTNVNYATSFTATRMMRLNKGILEQRQILDEGQALVMRTRVKVDESGKIISCRYSKIYGPLLAAGVFKFRQSSFNPDDNDSNLEFDILANLSASPVSGFVP